MLLGFIISFFYVANVISRPKALAEMTVADYVELHEV
jgi:hypothetical protein